MDTEKLLEVEHKIEKGKSLSDEGPYYHHTWWESYKGASKGELGGTVVGTVLGAAVGTIVGLASLSFVGLPGAVGILGAFSAGGLIYGVHKFTNIGTVSGAVASAAHQEEVRMRAFEEGKFSELKQDICELKAMVKGEPAPAPTQKKLAKEIVADLDNYRVTHYAKIEAPLKNKYVFWKIALVGLVIGVGAGALLAATGASSLLLGELGLIGEHGVLTVLGPHAASIASMLAVGALGASIGINRDVFRKMFDKTDLWFKGVLGGKQHDIVEAAQAAAGRKIKNGSHHKSEDADIATVTAPYDGYIDYPTSSTHHRDKVMAAAEKALLSFDHTRATPQ